MVLLLRLIFHGDRKTNPMMIKPMICRVRRKKETWHAVCFGVGVGFCARKEVSSEPAGLSLANEIRMALKHLQVLVD